MARQNRDRVVVVVTGASAGVGRAVARAFGDEGAKAARRRTSDSQRRR